MRDALERVLAGIPDPAIAVSGGVDSVTLSAVACALLDDVTLIHAVSPAVPLAATARLRSLATQRGWPLVVIEAGEFADPNYRANPVNRCFHCKTSLYATMRTGTSRQILSGANMDDLGEYRPGLDAARRYGVRHPYIEAGLHKETVRQIARQMDLPEIAELPASPCLSSRVETGIRIEPETLRFIDAVEQAIAARLDATTVRCRIRASAVVVELDAAALAALGGDAARDITDFIGAHPDRPLSLPVRFEAYRNGSAFLIDRR